MKNFFLFILFLLTPLFLFAENLINNRSKLKESESFILTLQKDRNITGIEKKRVNVRKILSLEEVINKTYKI